ncbi:MAG: filamentous hemagglutinin N-terminal domain-containing protein [Thiotrichaceae bacterium]
MLQFTHFGRGDHRWQFRRAVTLSGKEYQITEQLGTRYGDNLFHSFEKFDLNAGEIATFTGSSTIENVFGRITNGIASHINGTIRSDIPDIAIYLLNPAGFLFGSQAHLDTQGIFVATTGDIIEFHDKGVLFADPQRRSSFVADPQAFGFIRENPQPIYLQGSHFNFPDNQFTLLFGGDIYLDDAHISTPQNTQPNTNLVGGSGIALVSFASAGKLTLHLEDNEQVDAQSFLLQPEGVAHFGRVILDHHSSLNAAGQGRGSGLIYIRGDEVLLNNSSEINADTSGDGAGSLVFIESTTTTLRNNSQIRSSLLQGEGSGSAILLKSEHISLNDQSKLNADTQGSGSGGTVILQANQIDLQDAQISTNSLNMGKGGDIYIVAEQFRSRSTQPLSDLENIRQTPTKDKTYTSFNNTIGANALGSGAAGSVTIQAKHIDLAGRTVVSSGSFGAGKGGSVFFKINNGILREGTVISSSSFDVGDGGNISVVAEDNLTLDESFISSGSFASNSDAGNAGEVAVQASRLSLLHQSIIKSGTFWVGETASPSILHANGGSIKVQIDKLLYLDESAIDSMVSNGIGNGGNITLTNPELVVLNQSALVARADTGKGGNIHLAVDHLIRSADSFINASSRLGIDGKVFIDSPEQPLTDSVFALPVEFLNAEAQFPRSCRAYTRNQRPSEFQRPLSFTVSLYRGRRAPEDIGPSQSYCWQ